MQDKPKLQLTIAKLQESMTGEIFPFSVDKIEMYCHVRELLIRNSIRDVWKMIETHIESPGLIHKSDWKKYKIESCIYNLSMYLERLVELLDREKIIEHCREIKRNPPLQFDYFDEDLLLLGSNSYYGVIVADLYWLRDITVYDFIQLQKGKFEYESLERYIPDLISNFKNKVIPYFLYHNDFKNYAHSISEAIKCFEQKFVKAGSVLLITIIEGVVRKYGAILTSKQNLNIDPYNSKYNSLSAFLRNIPWKEDFKISHNRITTLNGDFPGIEVIRNYPEKYTTVGYGKRLEFLRRRFKEDRDIILHGLETEYDKPWRFYINLSAMYEVYMAIYEHENSIVSE